MKTVDEVKQQIIAEEQDKVRVALASDALEISVKIPDLDLLVTDLAIDLEAGTIEGQTLHSEGYFQIGYGGTTLLVHRVIMAILLGRWFPSWVIVDHVNGVRSDGRPKNLRLTTPKGNANNVNFPYQGLVDGLTGQEFIDGSKARNASALQSIVPKAYVDSVPEVDPDIPVLDQPGFCNCFAEEELGRLSRLGVQIFADEIEEIKAHGYGQNGKGFYLLFDPRRDLYNPFYDQSLWAVVEPARERSRARRAVVREQELKERAGLQELDRWGHVVAPRYAGAQ